MSVFLLENCEHEPPKNTRISPTVFYYKHMVTTFLRKWIFVFNESAISKRIIFPFSGWNLELRNISANFVRIRYEKDRDEKGLFPSSLKEQS